MKNLLEWIFRFLATTGASGLFQHPQAHDMRLSGRLRNRTGLLTTKQLDHALSLQARINRKERNLILHDV